MNEEELKIEIVYFQMPNSFAWQQKKKEEENNENIDKLFNAMQQFTADKSTKYKTIQTKKWFKTMFNVKSIM